MKLALMCSYWFADPVKDADGVKLQPEKSKDVFMEEDEVTRCAG